MSGRRRIVRVPASSANLGSGYDVLGAALELELELDVSEASGYSFDAGGLDVPTGHDNLIVRSFERLHPADEIAFRMRSEIPLARGLGSSAAAILAGLLAADHLFELANTREELFALACEIEGHPDNVAAALFGGIAVAAPASTEAMPAMLAPPEGVEGLLVIPAEEVSTEDARAAMPAELPIADAIANVAAASSLVLGIERSDLTLIERGLADWIHQDRRAHLYPRSIEVVRAAREVGALGATISGAGPAVLVWSFWQSGAKVLEGLDAMCAGWAEVRRVPFSPRGARVELPR